MDSSWHDPNSFYPRHNLKLTKQLSQVLDKKRLQELVKEVDPNEQLDEDVEELLLHIADDFIEQVGLGCVAK